MYETWLPTEVEAKLAKGEQLMIVDVRELDEWNSGHIPGSKHIPLGEVTLRKGELNKSKFTIIVCHSGGRSGRACEYLSAEGYQVVNMMGGMSQWYGKTV